ncbi:MAG: aspartate aminotransferase family protein [Proteobacteria bacterium]|nr:aspartate aminotransferase family protein [Pseudomonadota bacterium]
MTALPHPLADALDRAASHAKTFRAGIDDGLQRPALDYPAMLARAAAPLPEAGIAAAEVIEQLVELATPGLHKMAGRRFFGWVIGNSHPAGVAADWLASAWGQNAANPQASPAACALETVASSWLLELLDLPRESSVGFVTGATLANFVCLAAARDELLRRAGWDAAADGLFGAPPVEVVIGAEAHATVFSGLQFLGLGRNRVHRVATNAQGAILPEAFATVLAAVRSPPLVVLQAGQINSGAFDDFARLVPLARARGAWIHVDGAFGLWARASMRLAALAAGVELADSWATDGHKWLQTPYDGGFAIVRDAAAHARAMSTTASYLPGVAGERDPSHFVPELSRRARGFATWALIRHLGRAGIAAMVERHVELAQRMAARLGHEPGVTVVNEVVLNQLVVRFGADRTPAEGDRLTRATIARIQADGECFAGGAQWHGAWVMRISVIGFDTTEADADRSVEAMLRAWRAVRSGAAAD